MLPPAIMLLLSAISFDCSVRDFLTLEEAFFRGFSGLFQILKGISGLRKKLLLSD
jgi:hypothetical protein